MKYQIFFVVITILFNTYASGKELSKEQINSVKIQTGPNREKCPPKVSMCNSTHVYNFGFVTPNFIHSYIHCLNQEPIDTLS